ncbi:MAG: hypothetical protein J5825_02675 [Lachnospiraceae bacterium]|nr:hypothetical protein [Lachnospiraceae bacterium]
MKQHPVRFIWNILIAGFMTLGVLMAFFTTAENALLISGFSVLRYFTTLSNIYAGIVAVIFLIFSFRPEMPRFVTCLKYNSAAAVGLTFFVVIGFLGLIYGYPMMYQGANFWLHLIVPVMAMGEFIVTKNEGMKWLDNLLCVVPMFCYGVWYMSNAAINGVEKNDWYAFIRWGWPIGIVIFAVLMVVTFLIGLGLRGGRALVARKKK